MSERTEIQAPVINTLINLDYLTIRVNGGKRGNVWFYIWRVAGLVAQYVGIPDVVGCSPSGRFFCVEFKIPGEKPRPKQIEFMQQVTRRGGLVAVVDSADWQPPPEWDYTVLE